MSSMSLLFELDLTYGPFYFYSNVSSVSTRVQRQVCALMHEVHSRHNYRVWFLMPSMHDELQNMHVTDCRVLAKN